MRSYSEYFTSINKNNSFFAGANTPFGFVSEYKNLIKEEDFEKVYIIKGGSGTGKSTLIRRLAAEGESAGWSVTYILCSSDPDSLDGAIIEKGERRIGLVDGTSPHTLDPVYAGVCGEIVNCGDHWDASLLEGGRKEVTALIKEKSELYKRAYRYLRGAYEVCQMQSALAGYCLEGEKMQRAIKRLVSSIGSYKGKGTVTYRRTAAVSTKGSVRLTSFESAKHLYGIRDCAFLSPLFYEALLTALTDNGLDAVVSEFPVFGIGEIFVRVADISFVPLREGQSYERIINLGRFADREKMAHVKEKRIFSSKCCGAMMEGAEEALFECRDLHLRLEGIYKDAMDFHGLDRVGTALSKSIAQRLSSGGIE